MDSSSSQTPLTCSIAEFARIVGIGEEAARAAIASACPPPHIRAGRVVRVVRASIPAWLDDAARRESGRRSA